MRLLMILLGLFISTARASAGFDFNQLGELAGKLPKPTATLEKFDIKQISLRDITFTFDVGINNPYPIDLTLAGVDLDFAVEGNKVFHTTTSQGLSVRAKGKAVTSFDVTLTYESIIKTIQDYGSRDFLTCDTDVLIRIPIPKTLQLQSLPPSVDFPFKLSQKIPAMKPRVTIAAFKVTAPTVAEVKQSLEDAAAAKVKNLDAQKVWSMFNTMVKGGAIPKPMIKPTDLDLRFKVGFDIVLQNDTKAPLDFKSLQFDFLVNSNPLVKGSTTAIQKNGNATTLRVVNEFSSKNLTPDVLNAFKKGAGTFTLAGGTTIAFPPEVLAHPLQLEFKEGGSFKLR